MQHYVPCPFLNKPARFRRAGQLHFFERLYTMFTESTVPTQHSLLAGLAAVGICGLVLVVGVAANSAPTSGRAAEEAAPQSAKAVRGATPYAEITDEPAPKLIVDPPLPDALTRGVVWIQWRAENVHIVPVFGKGALHVSPRIGHLHIHVDDLPWWWADASNNNTIDLAGMPPGEHKVLIELVDANHQVFPGQAKTVTFTVPGTAWHSH
jgi:hypothetical protein